MAAELDQRVSSYLALQGLADDVQRTVLLTGDASDRRYVRVLLRSQPSIVLSVHAGPIDYAASPFVRVAALFAAVPLPVPALLHHDDALGIIAQQDLPPEWRTLADLVRASYEPEGPAEPRPEGTD